MCPILAMVCFLVWSLWYGSWHLSLVVTMMLQKAGQSLSAVTFAWRVEAGIKFKNTKTMIWNTESGLWNGPH